jgi:nucleoside-diphosphate-sugar epimerase
VRPPWFYGPPQPARQTEFFEMIRRGRVPLVGGGGNLRSMVYVDNLCQGLLLCGESARARGQTYWIADRWPYAMSQIVDTIERVMAEDFGFRVSGRRIRVPNIVSDVAWLGDLALQAAGLYVQKLHVLSEMNMNIACSIAKAETELGYAPGIDLEEGMRRSLQWCVDTGALDPDSD